MAGMKKRTITGAVITAAVYAVLFFSHIPAVLAAAVAVLNIVSVFELFQSAGIDHNIPMLCASVVAAVVLSLIPIPIYGDLLRFVFPAAVLVYCIIMRDIGRRTLDLPIQIFGLSILSALLFRAVLEVRQLEQGFYYLAFAVTLAFAVDVAAYLTGSAFGKRKLCPKISPNKTVAGSIGGILGAVGVMVLLGYLAQKLCGLQVSYGMLCLYAVLASIAAQFGDLAMSAVKRCMGVKDFGHLLPGHGGFLDRFDSHMFAVSFTFLFCTLTGGYLS